VGNGKKVFCFVGRVAGFGFGVYGFVFTVHAGYAVCLCF
jgi:hypothetical protein